MSNLPPGVTGSEYQIAGGREYDLPRTCGAPDAAILLPADDVRWFASMALGILRGDIITRSTQRVAAAAYLERIEAAYAAGEKIEVGNCPFDGEVTVEFFGGICRWTCPMCDKEHEEDVADGRD